MGIIRETAEMSDIERMVARNSNMQYFLNDFWDKIYPVGSIYISAADTSPSTLFGGTWEQIKDTFLLAAGDTYAAGATGGEATHTLTVDEMPSHKHGTTSWGGTLQPMSNKLAFGNVATTGDGNVSTADNFLGIKEAGNSQPHNNMPPYLAVYVWKRTA